MRRAVLAVLALLALWLLSAIAVGVYYAADGGHGGSPSVILASVGLGAILLVADVALMRRLRHGEMRKA